MRVSHLVLSLLVLSLCISQSLASIGWACGNNTSGQLGLGLSGAASFGTYQRMKALGNGGNIVSIVAGEDHTVVLDDTGNVHVMGQGNRIGLGEPALDRTSPTQLAFGPAENVTSVHSHPDSDHTIVLVQRGSPPEMIGWGRNAYNQLGTGSESSLETSPVFVNVPSGFDAVALVQVSAGKWHNLARDSAGRVWGWGDNEFFQLADPVVYNYTEPTLLDYFDTNGVNRDVAAGSLVSFVVDSTGRVYVFGSSSDGSHRAGTGSSANYATPTALNDFGDVVDVETSNDFSMAVTSDGELWTWGTGATGQVSTTTPFPTQLILPAGATQVAQAVVGVDTAAAVTSSGQVYMWGQGKHGLLCDGRIDTHNRVRPIEVLELTNVRPDSIVFGDTATFILTDDSANLDNSGTGGTSEADDTENPISPLVMFGAGAGIVVLGVAAMAVVRSTKKNRDMEESTRKIAAAQQSSHSRPANPVPMVSNAPSVHSSVHHGVHTAKPLGVTPVINAAPSTHVPMASPGTVPSGGVMSRETVLFSTGAQMAHIERVEGEALPVAGTGNAGRSGPRGAQRKPSRSPNGRRPSQQRRGSSNRRKNSSNSRGGGGGGRRSPRTSPRRPARV